MSLATPDNLITFFDENTVRDLLSDTGEPVTNLDTNTTALTLISAASGRLLAACTVSNLYTEAELTALTGDSQALMQEIVCGLAMVSAVRRRPEKFGSDYWKAVKEEYEDYLDKLKRGERLFDKATARDAGLPTVDGPSVTDYDRLNMIPDRTRNYYPSRGSRLPTNRTL